MIFANYLFVINYIYGTTIWNIFYRIITFLLFSIYLLFQIIENIVC